MGEVVLARVYDRAPTRGRTFFVERLWPRGVRRDELPAGAWVKDVAPSADLRRWYSARDPDHNSALVLRDYLLRQLHAAAGVTGPR